MTTRDRLTFRDSCDASVIRAARTLDHLPIQGMFHAELVRDGKVIWEDTYPNTVMDLGVNALFDAALAGSAYTVTGPYMGLISLTGFTAIVASNTMASHPGWLEAGNANLPHYVGARATMTWLPAAARTKQMSPAASFTFSLGGTVKGTFITFGAGAVNTIDNTGGTLFAAGLFASGDKLVGIGDVLNATYQISG